MATSYFLSLKPLSLPPLSSPFRASTLTTHELTLTTNFPHPKSHSFPKIPLSSFNNNNNTPSETECPVPLDQQPINEYQALSNSFPFSWASSDVVEYSSRLFVTGACFALFVGLPVSWLGSVGPKDEPIRLVLAAASSGIFVVILAVVRMYLGWA